MIARFARENFAHRLRILGAGLITNDQFEDSLIGDRRDPALHKIFMEGAWLLYSDLEEYHLIGERKLDKGQKKFVSRLVLFLKSDLPYQWREPHWIISIPIWILGMLSFGFVSKVFYSAYWKRQGDIQIWPFFRRMDYENALAHPVYLSRKTSPCRPASRGIWNDESTFAWSKGPVSEP